jgi:hypothetical protein
MQYSGMNIHMQRRQPRLRLARFTQPLDVCRHTGAPVRRGLPVAFKQRV